ncbi:hypothetical protein [Acinetobacter soli]|uniref:hypothetical protein n=1 Tax=Acinetobacter soli TaxID=487316 RepID=UPI0012507A04|nr:hypothetical protein [Acinetobacter soli]
MINLNAQLEIRASLCKQYLTAGEHDAATIIANVKALESFIFGDAQTLPNVGENTPSSSKTAEPGQTAVTENKAEAAKVKKAEEVKAVQESEQTESTEPKYNSDEVRAALIAYGKTKGSAGKEAILEILTAVGATSVPSLKESDYAKVMELVDLKQKEQA